MRRSLDTSAHVTSAIEVDMSKVAAIRSKLKKEYQQSYGVNPTYLIFVARARPRRCGVPLGQRRDPRRPDRTRSYVNLGFAVELQDGKGLIVPVVKNAETLNLLGMAKAVTDIASAPATSCCPTRSRAARSRSPARRLRTFHGTPVISQPQAAILGTYAVVKRAWVIQDDMGEDVIAIARS
jgi:2-oxoglutarate dehydrogenase E2 component (dihydrolipoamide succinyltransferase)